MKVFGSDLPFHRISETARVHSVTIHRNGHDFFNLHPTLYELVQLVMAGVILQVLQDIGVVGEGGEVGRKGVPRDEKYLFWRVDSVIAYRIDHVTGVSRKSVFDCLGSFRRKRYYCSFVKHDSA